MELAKTAVRNSAHILFERSISYLLNFLTTIYIIRYFGPNQYGVFSYVVAFSSFFQILVAFGLDTILVREISRSRQQINLLFSTAFWLSTAFAFVSFAIVNTVSVCYNTDSSVRFYVFILSLGYLFSQSTIISSIFQASISMKPLLKFNIIVSIFMCLLRLILIMFQFPLYLFVILISLNAIILTIGYYFASIKFCAYRITMDFSKPHAKLLMLESWPIGVSAFLIAIYLRIDQVLLYQIADASELGKYAAVVRLTEVWNIIPAIIIISFYPIFCRIHNDRDSFSRWYKFAFRLMSYVAIPICLFLTAYSNQITDLLIGPQYIGSAPILAVIIWSSIFVYWGTINNALMKATGTQHLDLIFTSVTAVVNIVTNLLLIPKYGAMGAAIATSISYGIGSLLGFVIPKTRDFSIAMWLSAPIPILLLSLPVILLSFYVRSVVVAGLIFGSITLLAYTLTWARFRTQEFILLKTIFLRSQ
jgi:O-antigen/teichoic acid export membrane protein